MPKLWNASIQNRDVQSCRVLKLQSTLLLDLQVQAWVKSLCILQRVWLSRPPSHSKLLARHSTTQCLDDADVSSDLGLRTDDHSSTLLSDADDDRGLERKVLETNKEFPTCQH